MKLPGPAGVEWLKLLRQFLKSMSSSRMMVFPVTSLMSASGWIQCQQRFFRFLWGSLQSCCWSASGAAARSTMGYLHHWFDNQRLKCFSRQEQDEDAGPPCSCLLCRPVKRSRTSFLSDPPVAPETAEVPPSSSSDRVIGTISNCGFN